MIITNRSNLPEPIVQAVINDPYNAGDCDISVTTLINPPQIRILGEKYKDRISEDVSDRVWALFGQSVHYIIEKAQGKDDLQECRFFMDFLGKRISGQADNYDTKTGIITDYKVTSIYKVKKGISDPTNATWVQQLNVLAELVRQNGGEVNGLQIVAFLRDWSKSKFLREKDCPEAQVILMKVPVWSTEQCHSYMASRISSHYQYETNIGVIQPCTFDERWARPDKWAVMKKGAKRAIKLHEEEADAIRQTLNMNGQVNEKGDKYSVEFRKGESIRCEQYCSVSQFCPQFKKMKED